MRVKPGFMGYSCEADGGCGSSGGGGGFHQASMIGLRRQPSPEPGSDRARDDLDDVLRLDDRGTRLFRADLGPSVVGVCPAGLELTQLTSNVTAESGSCVREFCEPGPGPACVFGAAIPAASSAACAA
jgi:hypothetical protein